MQIFRLSMFLAVRQVIRILPILSVFLRDLICFRNELEKITKNKLFERTKKEELRSRFRVSFALGKNQQKGKYFGTRSCR